MVTAEVTERQAHRQRDKAKPGAEAAAQRRRGSEVVSGRSHWHLFINSRYSRCWHITYSCGGPFRELISLDGPNSKHGSTSWVTGPASIDRNPSANCDEMLQGPLFRVRRASTLIEPIHSLFCCAKFPVRAKAIPCSVAQGILQ